jgi:TorA maturation chaperone TorD
MATAALRDPTLAARLDAFGTAYVAMSRFVLASVDRDLSERLGKPGQIESWPMPRDTDTSRGLELVRTSLESAEAVAALERDYERLFTLPDSVVAPPYESVWRTPERLLFDAPTFEVRAEYRSLGVQAPSLNRDPDDHLGLEFNFLGLVCSHALDAHDRGDTAGLDQALETQRRFLGDHLLRWGPDFLASVEAKAETAFYKGVGALGLGVLTNAAAW